MKMIIYWTAVSLLFFAASLDAQDDEKTVIELKQPEPDTKSAAAPPLVGMEAFREVMRSGEYRVGPGDQFLVHIPGMETPYNALVLAEGGIFIPQVGSVFVGGLSLVAARARVERRFAEVLRVGELTFELSQARQFPVPVLGLVGDPGIKAASGVERISQVLQKAGGLLSSASKRNILLIKTVDLTDEQRAVVSRGVALGLIPDELRDLAIERVDLELYEVTGELRYNPFVEDGDIVLVTSQQGRMAALGALRRPSFFEFMPGDRLSDLLRLSLGPTVDVDYSKVWLFRFEDDMTTRVTVPVDLKAVLAGDANTDLALRADDWLVVRSIPSYHQEREVRVVGEVVYPGHYVVGPRGMTLRELVETAGGFSKRAALAEARVVRQKFVEGEKNADPEFERIRFIPVPERTEDENQYFIMKTRERAGQMSVDLIKLFREGDETHNIPLMPGDVLVVPTLQSTVAVSGAVAQPGLMIFDESYGVWDYIELAGGYSWRASKDVRVIKGRTGEIKRVRDGVVQIQPGDRIWIKEKPERDYWTIFTQGMGVIGQVSTIVLLYVSITK